MFTVALIGPDGAGKSTIGRQLERRLSGEGFPPIKYVYMGVNLDSSNLVLPTTRLLLEVKRALGGRPNMAGPPDPTQRKLRPKNSVKRLLSELKSSIRLANLMAEEWFRQGVVWYYQWRGYVVLLDRHFFTDYYAYEIAHPAPGRPLANRVHGFMLQHLYPKPDLIICLDAPPEVLFARKGEGTLAFLEHRRQEYLQLRDAVKHFATVDATQPTEVVAQQVAGLIGDFYRTRTGKTVGTSDV